MSVRGFSKERFQGVLTDHFTPSKEIQTLSRLYGRQNALQRIERALGSQGRHIFLYGDRGVGKTSVARTAAVLHNSGGHAPIYVSCGASGYGDALQAIGNAVLEIEKRFEPPVSGRSGGLSAFGFGASLNLGSAGTPGIAKPETLNQSLDIIRYVCSKRPGRLVIVVDEMERLTSKDDRNKFAELIKNLSTIDADFRFIFCGIASDVDELLNSHESAGRILEAIKLEKLRHDELWKIITSAGDAVGLQIDREMLIRIGQISDGFPHYVHLIGEELFWQSFDDLDQVTSVTRTHYVAAIKGALQRTEAALRNGYQRATQKSAKNTVEYEEALWSVADSTADRRQVQDIHASSYLRIMERRGDRQALKRDQFNHRLLALCKESHGRILLRHGSGWFSFRENIMRGYVRLTAEEQGVELGNLAVIS